MTDYAAKRYRGSFLREVSVRGADRKSGEIPSSGRPADVVGQQRELAILKLTNRSIMVFDVTLRHFTVLTYTVLTQIALFSDEKENEKAEGCLDEMK